jgi:hypothetical protein
MAKESILGVLAKELGYKDPKELKQRIGSGGDFSSNLKSRVESGEGLLSSIAESTKGRIKDIRETFSAKGLKRIGRKAYMSAFGGDDILSSYMRGRIQNKVDKIDATKNVIADTKEISGVQQESVSLDNISLKLVTQNSMTLPGIARDMNVMRQNMQKLVKIWGDKDTNVATGADAHMLKESERAKKLEVMSEEERKKDISFFEEQDKKEAELEAGRGKKEGATVVQAGDQPEKKEGFLDNIIAMFSNGFMNGIKSLFSVKNLLTVVKRVFLPLVIIGTLFSGIMDGFKRYKETGSFSEAIVAGLGGMFSFLTVGLVNEDTLKNLWDKVSGFFEPVMSTITGIFKGIKDFFKKMFGGTVDVEDTDPKADATKPAMPDTKSFTPGKETKTEPPKTEAAPTPPAPAPTPTSPTPVAKTPATTPTATPAKSKAVLEVEAEKNYQNYEVTLAELKDYYLDKRDEKNQMMQKLMSDPRYPDGVIDDPSSPEYPKELKAIDEKYDKLIAVAKKTVEDYKNKPGVKEYIKKIEAKSKDKFFDEDDIEDELGDKKLTTKVAGSKFTTTQTETVSGGGSTINKRVLSEDAKKAQEELKKLDDRQAEERKKVVDKLKSEGKITGRFAKSSDFQNIDELKNLKAKQDAERANLVQRIDSGTSMQTTSTPGAAPSGGGGGSVSAAPSESAKAPSAISAQPPTSGSELSSASSQIAEGQRMESAADIGSVVNSPITNNSSSSAGKQPKQKSSNVYNEDLTALLVGT